MEKQSLKKVNPRKVLLALLLLIATVGGVAMAHGHGAAGFFAADVGGGPVAALQFLRSLELRDDQIEHLHNIHGLVHGARDRHVGGAGSHALQVAEKLDSGELFTEDEGRAQVDFLLEHTRSTAYAATDEIVALLNSLDTEQRTLLSEHLVTVAALHAEKAEDSDRFGHGRWLRHLLGSGQP
ncbi:MAG: hypothetical protein AAGM22_07370 [Acidobacteriota bacterium]